MTERIENIIYTDDPVAGTTLFLDGPAEFLVKNIASQLSLDSKWVEIFNGYIDPYMRMDYPERALPVLRIYNEIADKQFESWFIEGDIKADVIFPASIRRGENQQLQDTISYALLQQFRRTTFFNAVADTFGNPSALNELGKRFRVDKSLGFEWQDGVVPLTQITINFRIDLRQWDVYLENTLRTKDDPFDQTLGNLKRIVTQVQALRDDGETEVVVTVDQIPGQPPQT
jgi:hypothetical protein